MSAELMSAPVIEVEHLHKTVTDSTGALEILRDIHFSLQPRQTAAIVGASGSGKSTLLSMLAGLDTPTQGTVRLQGQDIFALDEDARAGLRGQKMGFVFQSFQLLPNLTALENVMLPLELIPRPGMDRGAITQKAQEWLERVGLADRLDHTPRQLSGGEQQRVALARAFAPGPQILFADEPTGSLDSTTGERVADLLFELNRATGTTLILVTHDERLAGRCEWRLRLDSGKLTEFVQGGER